MGIARARFVGTSLTLVLASCGDDPNGPDPAVALSVSPATISVQQGRSDSVVVQIHGLNGFASPVTLSLEGTPAGVVAGFRSTSVPIPANTGVNTGLLIAVDASAAPGNHTLTVRVRGQGVDDRTAAVTLTIIHAPGTLALALTPAARTIAPGQSETLTARVTRGGSFTSSVELAAEGVPSGVTVSFNPASISTGANTSAVTIAVAASAASGQYAIVVRGRGEGVSDQIAAFALTVAAPGISLSVSPATAIVEEAGRAAVEVRLTRSGNFTGAVTFALEDAPAGVTGTFAPNPQTGTRSALLIEVAPGTPPGVHPVTVRGTTLGLPDAVTMLSLQIPQASGAHNVSFRFCATRPIWVAAQDDTGPWTRVSAGPNETYSFTVSSRGGVAIVRPFGSAYRIDLLYATATELADIGSQWDRSCPTPLGPKELTGTLAGVDGQSVLISLGPRSAGISQDRTSYTLRNVPDGALDLVASRGNAGPFDFDASKIIIRRRLDVPNGSTIPLLDFNAAEAITPMPASLTLSGAGSGELSWLMTHRTAGGTEEVLNGHLFGSPVSTLSYSGVPSSLQTAGDVHLLFVEDAASNDLRRLFTAFHRAENRSVTLGPRLATPTVSVVASSPYVRYTMVLPRQSEYGSEVVGRFVQPATLARNEIAATSGYFGGSPTQWDLAVPDLTAAAGFDPTWGLRPGAATVWEAFATSGSFFLPLSLDDGETVRSAGRWQSAPTASVAARRSFGVVSLRDAFQQARASWRGPLWDGTP